MTEYYVVKRDGYYAIYKEGNPWCIDTTMTLIGAKFWLWRRRKGGDMIDKVVYRRKIK